MHLLKLFGSVLFAAFFVMWAQALVVTSFEATTQKGKTLLWVIAIALCMIGLLAVAIV